MPKHLFFISSVIEAKQSLVIIKGFGKSDSYKIISNNPLANLYFDEQKISYQDSGIYFPQNRNLRHDYWRLVDIVKQWPKDSELKSLLSYDGFGLDEIIGFSLIIYLCEVKHSLLMAKNILRTCKPNIIYLSPDFSESPFRRYQSENLNLENLALLNLVKTQSIQVKPLSSSNYYKKIFYETVMSLGQTIKYSLKQLTASPLKVDPKSIAVLSHHYQLKNLNPFLRKFANNKNYSVMGHADSAQSEQLKTEGFNFIRLDGLFPVKQNIGSTKFAHLIKYFNLWIKHQQSIKKYFDHKNPCYWPLLKRKFEYYFLAEFPQIIEYLELGKRIFSSGKTKILLASATTDIASKCYALTASRQGAKVIELQHGMVIYDEEWPFRANQIHAVWGKDLLKIMNQGKSIKSLSITGFPYFDQYKEKNHQPNKKWNGRTILILSVFPTSADRLIAESSPMQFLTILLSALEKSQYKWKVIFRPHPSNNATWVKQLAEKSKVNIVYDQRRIPLDEAIAASDIVIGNFTTAIVDAFVLEKPVLLYSFANQDSIKLNQHPLITSGAVSLFDTSSKLETLLIKIYKDKIYVNKMLTGQKEFLKSYCSINGKFVSEKLLTLINNQLHN